MYRYLSILLPCLLLASGCVSTVTIDAEDNGARFSELSASLPLEADGTRLRFRGTRVNGEFDQQLDADERIAIDDSSIFGPAEVDGDLDLSYYSVALGFRSDTGTLNSPRFEYYFGLAQTRFDLTLDSDGNEYDTRDSTTELYLQYVVAAPISGDLDFAFSWAFSLGRELSGINELDLRLEYPLTKHLALAGGYRWFDYEYGLGEDESHLSVELRGPYLALSIPF